MHTYFGGFGMGGLGMILFWIAVIAVIVLLIKYLSDSSRGNRTGEKNANEILRERYAAGEISREEFKEKKKELARR